MDVSSAATSATQTCYRHPNRETGVSCSSCRRPICPDCMTPTPVGMRCPECARQRTQVRTMRTMTGEPRVTIAIIITCAVAFLASGAFGVGGAGAGNRLFDDFALNGPAVERGHEYWRLISGGFLHAGFLHILFNMYLLWVLGQMLEPTLGSRRFATVYFTALLCGSFGALAVEPLANTVGASGAVFGLMGAAFVFQRLRGVDPMQSGIGPMILLNLGITFLIPNISIGGHLGGLIGGGLAALAMERLEGRSRSVWVPVAACVSIAVVAVAAGIAAANRGGAGVAMLLGLLG